MGQDVVELSQGSPILMAAGVRGPKREEVLCFGHWVDFSQCSRVFYVWQFLLAQGLARMRERQPVACMATTSGQFLGQMARTPDYYWIGQVIH